MRIFLATIALLFLFSLPAYAADTSWTVGANPEPVVRVSGKDTVYVSYLNRTACRGQGNLFFRRWTASGWTGQKALRGCEDAQMEQPSLARDMATGTLVAVWSQTSFTKPARSGVFYTVSRNKGKQWSRPRRLVKLGTDGSVLLTAALRGNVLWVMRQTPKDGSDQFPLFAVEGYDIRNARLVKKNMAVSSRDFKADRQPGAMRLYASKLGLLAVWQRTDAAGTTRLYLADTASYVDPLKKPGAKTKLGYRGRTTDGTFIVGEDNLPYLFAESEYTTEEGQRIVNYAVRRWSWTTHQFEAAVAGKPTPLTLTTPPNDGSKTTIAYQVGPDSSLYIAHRDYSLLPVDAEPCFASAAGQPCVQSTAPAPGTATVAVSRITPAGAISRVLIPYPFAPLAPAGAVVIQWWWSNLNIETLTTTPTGPRLVYAVGHQDISDKGTTGADSAETVVVTDPLSLTPVS